MKGLCLAILAVLPALTVQQCLTSDDTKVSTDPSSRPSLYNGEQQFALNMLQQVNKMFPSDNIFFSPFSVYNALLLAYFTAAGKTEASIKKVLSLPEQQDKLSIMQAYRLEKYLQRMRDFNGSASYEFSSANRLFLSPNEKVRECMEELFEEEIALTDFAKDPKAAVKMINTWVANMTRNQIKDLLGEDYLDASTKLVLANAAYFKGVWQTQFQPQLTRKEVFYISTAQNAFVTMMKQKSTFNHLVSEKLGAHILELPYKGQDISMFILLPPFISPNGIANILSRLTIENFKEIASQDSMIPRPVEVSIPKFEIEHEIQLTSILENMKIGDLFKPTSDLSGLTGKPGLKLDTAVHKSKISLDEKGTTAAAATLLLNNKISIPVTEVQFKCDRPFIYLIYNKAANTILFLGIFKKP